MNLANQKNIELYKKLINEHGNHFKSLNWGSVESQELRFQVLCQSTDINHKTILDVGCGLCDLHSYILNNNYFGFEYSGIDITEEMVILSKNKFPNIEILNCDINQIEKQYDCVFASGIFTYQSQVFLENFITSAFSKAKHVLAFNALSIWSDTMEQDEYYADPLETVAFCKSLSPFVTLRHDYHSRDFTIYLYKSRNK